jgi:hypothetical protein
MRYGKKQTLDTLINEEAYLLARYLRNEKQEWNPRLVELQIRRQMVQPRFHEEKPRSK